MNMNLKNISAIVEAGFSVFLVVGLNISALAQSAEKPNILFIMADDHCANAIGAYGSRLAKLNPTPTLDKLAADGMRLDSVFCGNSICSPSRATIMTGQYNQANGVLAFRTGLEPENQYLPKLLGENGYQTAIIGKWHLHTEPAAFEYYKILPGQGSYMNPEFYEKGKGTYPDNMVQIKGHSTDIMTDQTIDWLKNRDKSRPFFFCLHFKAAHGGWVCAPRYNKYLADADIPAPESLFTLGNHGSIATRGDNDELLPYIGTSVGSRNVLLGNPRNNRNTPEDEFKKKNNSDFVKKYLRCVKGIDDNLERLFEFMKAEGIFDNTVIMYTGDQGFYMGEHDYTDKRWMYEESMRMPLLVHYTPAIKAESVSRALINNTDFAPTILDYAGIKTPDYMHGVSFRKILETGETPDDWRKATYYRYWDHLAMHYNPGHFGIRTYRYKLIFFYGRSYVSKSDAPQTPPGWELYDLEKDPSEMNNIYDDPAYAQTIVDLKNQLIGLREKYGETDKDYPEIQAIIDRFWETTDENRTQAVKISHQAKDDFEKMRNNQERKQK